MSSLIALVNPIAVSVSLDSILSVWNWSKIKLEKASKEPLFSSLFITPCKSSLWLPAIACNACPSSSRLGISLDWRPSAST